MTTKVKAVTTRTFDQDVVQAQRPVLVDFYADWCGPCKFVGPIVEDIAGEYADQIEVRKIDVDENPELAGRYGVRSIPTLVLFKDGEAQETVVGAAPKSQLTDVIDRYAV